MRSGRRTALSTVASSCVSGGQLHERSGVTALLGGRLCEKYQQHDRADERNQDEQQPPCALVNIVQAARADGEAGEQYRDAEQPRQRIAEQGQRRIDEQDEEEPPPLFGPRGADREVGVFRKTDPDRFLECHVAAPSQNANACSPACISPAGILR